MDFSKKAVNAPPDTKKKALLQDTPTASVYSQLQKLTAQNPACKYIKELFQTTKLSLKP